MVIIVVPVEQFITVVPVEQLAVFQAQRGDGLELGVLDGNHEGCP